MIVLLAAVLGAILGSFLGVLIDRWPQWRGVLAGRSQCPHCKQVLAWYDLIPLASWAVAAGKCRYCGVRISAWYPAYELTTAVACAGFALQFGGLGMTVWDLWLVLPRLLILFGFIALFFFDLRHMVLPNAILVPMALLAIFASPGELFLFRMISASMLAAFFGVIYVISRGRWIGLGDVTMAIVVGFTLSFLAVPVTLVAVWAGALVGVILIALGRAHRKTPLPFGSFWAASAVVAILWPTPFLALNELFYQFMQ